MAGSSSYPTSVDNYTQRTDGVDIIIADDVNNPYVAINTIETFIGASGAGQSHNKDIIDQIVNNIFPSIRITYVSTTTVQASAGRCYPQNSGATIRKMRRNTSTTNITGSDLDSGGPSLAASTVYYVYANGDAAATTVTFKLSTNSSAPSGVTNYQRLGSFFTDASGNVIAQSVRTYFNLSEMAVAKTADESVTSSTTLQDDNDLQILLEANKKYIIEGALFFESASSTPDAKIAFVSPGAGAFDIYRGGWNGDSVLLREDNTRSADLLSASGTAVVVDVSASRPYQITLFSGYIEVGGTGGVFKLQWAQNASDATAVTLQKGSWMRVTEVL